jgi:hypothetical protein
MWAVPAVVSVMALPAMLPKVDIGPLIGERLVYLPATVGLGIWAARGGSKAAIYVLLAGIACLALILEPRGPQWPSYSYPDWALCLAVALALYQLQDAQISVLSKTMVTLALSLWVFDGLVAAPWCGALSDWHFTASTACGTAWGDPRASIPALAGLAGWLWVLRRAGPQ